HRSSRSPLVPYTTLFRSALGLGHAVLCAERMVGNEPFAVILADDLTDAEDPVMKQMVAQYARYGSSILGAQEISPEQSRSYGVRSEEHTSELQSREKLVC